MLVEKYVNNSPNTVHQGALFDTPTGEWWTILQQDLGCLGRFPNLQPVKWTSNWPVVGNNGKPYASYKKPTTGGCTRRMPLPTNDNFRSYPLGMQWQWNHNPDNGAWSLFERPGWLRLKTGAPVTRLTQARNMLTQRIFIYDDRPSIGSVRLDVSNLQEGDCAGICVFQDPYAMLAVRVKDGQRQLVWREDTLRVSDSFTPSEQVIDDNVDDIIYLRASINYSNSRTQFFYSTDNVTYQQVGGETTLGFNLTVFVGARFGLFCYATQDDSEGYADFDWFTTEYDFDESYFYPETFEGYNAEMLTAESLMLDKDVVEIMIGNSSALNLTASFRDGHTENVASAAKYTLSSDNVIDASRGLLRGLREGIVDVTATYTDPMGNQLTASFQVRSSFFPFSKEYITTNLFSEGTYTESTHTFKPGQYGQMGWQYANGADMSGYKYLVIKLKKTASGAHLNLFAAPSIWADCCATPDFGSKKQIVLNLSTATYTSGNKQGQKLDTQNIRIVSFWSNYGTIQVDDMYLTNNDDYSREDTDAIPSTLEPRPLTTDVYTLSGVLLRRQVESAKATQGLKPGIYIVGGRKVKI